MTVFQHYYTAWYDSARGSAGQQTKAQSPGIPFSLESDPTWAAMKDYALPPGITDRDIHRHPVALRYLPMAPDLVLLVHYTSTGTGADGERTDNEIRFGNMFVHTLMLSPRDFVKGDPIQYWGSPFWQSEDSEPTRHDLSEMLTFDVSPTLTLPQVVSFVQQQTAGWDKLTALLSAVISNARAPRPVLIVSEPDTVAHWIAGVSLLLPPPYRTHLTFSTYSHTYPSGYMVTGLHPEQFAKRHAPQDYQDYFVLGEDTDESTSYIAPDPYAQFATHCLREGRYESDLAPLFQIASQRFSAPKTVADNLEALLSTRTLFASNRTTPYTSAEVIALSEFVNAEATNPATEESDLEFLRNLHRTCLRAVALNLVPIPFQPYRQVVGALTQCAVSLCAHELVMDLCSALDLLTQNATHRPEEIAATVKLACQGSEYTEALAQQPEWTQALAAHSSASLPIHRRIWDVLGRFITPQTVPAMWIQATLDMAFGGVNGAHNQEQEMLEEILFQHCSPYALEWATRISELRGQLDYRTIRYVEQFYYDCLVRRIWPPRDRTSVRQIIREVAPNVSDTEVYEDLRKRAGEDGKDASSVLDEWFAFASQTPVRWTVVLENLALLSQVNAIPRSVVAALLARIDKSTKIKSRQAALYLAEAVISDIPFCWMSRDEELVCDAWYRDAQLTPQSREYARAIVEARRGHATAKSVELLKMKLFSGKMEPQQYQKRCEQFLWQRLTSDGAAASHGSDIEILYYHAWSDRFWKAYWFIFDYALFNSSNENMLIAFLGFWFEHAQSALGRMGYTDQEFLLQIANYFDVCAAMRKSELTNVYDRLQRRTPSPRWLKNVLQMISEALNKRRWPLEHMWRDMWRRVR